MLRIRTLLTAIPVVGILPLVAFSALLLGLLWESQQRELRRDMQQSVTALASAVDRELAATVRRLELLAASPSLRTDGPLEDFAPRAAQALALSPDWTGVALLDTQGRPRVDARAAGRSSQPDPLRPFHREAMLTMRPAVSDLIDDPQDPGGSALAVAVPVLGVDGVRAVLSARVDPAALSRLLADQSLRERGVAAIYDRDLRIVARNRDGQRFIGQLPVPDLARAMEESASGAMRTLSLEGRPVIAAWQRLPSGWAVAVGFPVSAYDSPLRRSMLLLGTAGIAVLLAAIVAALAMARHISRRIDLAGGQARRLVDEPEAGEPLAAAAAPPSPSRILELDRLHTALEQASMRLTATRAARDAAEQARAAALAAETAARRQAEAANRGKDEFLAMLGHELRNPLGAITNATRLLERAELPDSERARLHALLRRQTSHVGRLVDDLLDVGRVLEGKIRLQRAPTDLAEAVTRAVASLQTAGRTVHHALDVATTSAWIDGDATRLEQIATNLISNALKYTPAGRRIQVRVEKDAASAVLEVRDEGIGIEPELLARVFDLFVQGDQDLQRESGGLGIGLTLVRRLVELHGGTVRADSDGQDRGSTFTVRLPLTTRRPEGEARPGGDAGAGAGVMS